LKCFADIDRGDREAHVWKDECPATISNSQDARPA
jgi:hypothetical protein